MTDFLKPVGETTLSNFYGLVRKHVFDLRRRNGEWQRQTRETYASGDGAAVLLCSVADQSVILVRQFRYPAYFNGDNSYLVEVCAGKLDGDDPETCVRKEAIEETGYRITRLERATQCYSTPGSVTERITLFIGWIDDSSRIADGGGLHGEGEDIEVLKLPFADALAMVESGEIADAKTILLLQHAALKGVFA